MQAGRPAQPSATNRPRPSGTPPGPRRGAAAPPIRDEASRRCAAPRAPGKAPGGSSPAERPSRAGGPGGGGTPGPVPNPEVKPARAESTAGAAPREGRAPPAREGRLRGGFPESRPRGRFFCLCILFLNASLFSFICSFCQLAMTHQSHDACVCLNGVCLYTMPEK